MEWMTWSGCDKCDLHWQARKGSLDEVGTEADASCLVRGSLSAVHGALNVVCGQGCVGSSLSIVAGPAQIPFR